MYQEAVEALDEVTKIDPQSMKGWHNKGTAFNMMGMYEDALSCFEKATLIDPDYLGSWNDRGLVSYKLGRYEEALIFYEKALELDPENAMVLRCRFKESGWPRRSNSDIRTSYQDKS